MYSATTRNIRITVEPMFLEDQSEPERDHYLWAYRVTLENQGQETVQLLNRYWHITDGLGRVQEVRGPGVVGDQPVLQPGAQYQYTSGCPLKTPSGVMLGSYDMVRPDGSHFDAQIPAFSLDSPFEARKLN